MFEYNWKLIDQKQDTENREAKRYLENSEESKELTAADDQMSVSQSMSIFQSCRKRTKWFSQNLESSKLKGDDIRTHVLQNETNARMKRYTELNKNESEIHALNLEAVRCKVIAENYRAENERKQLEITELSKKAAEIKLKILERQYHNLLNKDDTENKYLNNKLLILFKLF